VKPEERAQRDNPRLWQIKAAHQAPAKPPYPATMAVTPLSVFSDAAWTYPLSWTSLNNRGRLTREHGAKVSLADGTRLGLDLDADAALVRQLKEACWAASHRRDLLEGQRTPSVPKPLTEAGIHANYRRLLVAFKKLGCTSLAQVGQAELDHAFHLIGPAPGQALTLAASFGSLVQFSKHGLITDGCRRFDLEFTKPPTILDASTERGLQPLSDEDTCSIIRLSLAYVKLSSEIAGQIELLRTEPGTAAEVFEWARATLPCGAKLQQDHLRQTLTFLVQVAASNLIAFHLGLRISELMSILSGFALHGADETLVDIKRITIEFTRYKTVRNYMGKTTRLAVHPDILIAAEALEEVRKANACPGEHLLVPAGDSLPYVTNKWNYYLQKFCDIHSLGFSISSHSWRETVAAVAVRVLTGAAFYIKELFGHAGLAMTARYMFASPFIRDEIGSLLLDEYRRRGKTLMESMSVFGGAGLGGRQGKEWEARFRKLSLDRDVTEQDLSRTQDEFLDEMLRQGVFPIPVMPGVYCVTRTTARGDCARTSKDRMPDPGRCVGSCRFQVQEAHRRDNIVSTVRKFASSRKASSPMQQRFWASQIIDQLHAWPELEGMLQDVISEWPKLKEAIDKDGK
jgi:hypothetical protein